ncbi:LAME_0G17304g1_1 [Lachancea meyersii CBS 8951]|uniref:ATP-dependent DNA helicase II subunit 2 n=1 Tax=Lachancea meyersii CBS 8951 TaxID=1266667 RepID=A0A1G4KBM1_9SACH|nr:LAME_0G17304g1_1 [Lachancea meyersii CBS 8951]
MGSEATTFILDVSPSMVKLGCAEQALAYIEYVLFLKAKKQRKTDWVNCFLANCSMTRNDHETDNVFELLPFTAPISAQRIIEALRELQRIIDEQRNDQKTINSMVQSLLISSVSMRDEFNKRKLRKQIMIFTNDLDGLDLTEQELETLKEEFDCRIILVTCGSKKKEEEEEGDFKQEKSIWEKCVDIIPGSIQVSVTELLQEITTPSPATVKPVRTFQGELRLGAAIVKTENSDDSYNSISIKVEGYPATKAVANLNRRVVARGDGDTYEPVKAIIEYEAFDRDENHSDESDEEEDRHGDSIDGKKNRKLRTVSIARESVTKAYRYGSDYVVLPQTIESERIYRTSPSLDIRGFASRGDIPKHYLNSESMFIVPAAKEGTRADCFALTALVDSMIQQNKLAIARFVQRFDSEVQMCVLCPLLVPKKRKQQGRDTDSNYRALVLSRLPFAEDERVSDYPRLTTNARDAKSTQNSEIDSLMDKFVETRSLGDGVGGSWCSTPLYEPVDAVVTSACSLPLPSTNARSRDTDICAAPAMGIHRQQQILIEYMHQRIVRGSDSFDVPELPSVYHDLLNPHFENSKLPTQKLQERLNIKLNPAGPSRVTPCDEQQDEDDEYYDIPSLESLLARGRS